MNLVKNILLKATNSPRALLGTYIFLIVVCSVGYHHFEKESIGDSIWWAVVTASTVGYGDISPQTFGGRALGAVLISVMVLLVIPLITAHFASKLIVDNDAFQHEEQEEIKNQLREIRALLERQQGSAPAAGSGQLPSH
jgi:voltage-gated potassium channel